MHRMEISCLEFETISTGLYINRKYISQVLEGTAARELGAMLREMILNFSKLQIRVNKQEEATIQKLPVIFGEVSI